MPRRVLHHGAQAAPSSPARPPPARGTPRRLCCETRRAASTQYASRALQRYRALARASRPWRGLLGTQAIASMSVEAHERDTRCLCFCAGCWGRWTRWPLG